LTQQIDYRYKANTPYPIVVEIYNTDGEMTTTVLYPWIVQKPLPICTTTQICPSNSTDGTNSTNGTNTTTTTTTSTSTQANGTADSTTNTTKPKRPPGVKPINSTKPSQNITQDPCTYTTECVEQEFNFTEDARPVRP